MYKGYERLIGCSCYECGIQVHPHIMYHQVAEDGRILCDECAKGEELISEEKRQKLIEIYKKEYGI